MEFPSNSHKANEGETAKPQDKKIDSVVTGDVLRRRKPLGKRFAETFIGGDAKSVWGYVMFEVLAPAAKDMFSDAVSQGVDRVLFGESRPGNRRGGRRREGSPNGYVSYNRFSSNNREEPRNVSRRARATHDFDEIILATRVEAEEVIDRLFDVVGKYEVATVSDLYDLVGITSSYTDSKWGWTDIRGAGATRIRNGYLLDLPKPEYIE